MAMRVSNVASFLVLLRAIVDDTSKDAPLTKNQILRKCDEQGVLINPNTFDRYIKEMEEGGIVVARRFAVEEPKKGGPLLYWYDKGWI